MRDDDELIEVKLTDDKKDIILVTKDGMCIRFKETDVRSTGRTSMGVRGMNIDDGDEVVAMQLNSQGDCLLIVSANGMGKRTSMGEFTCQNRGGKGVKCYKITEKTGDVIGARAVNEDNEVMLITTEGIIIRIACADISILGRITSGVKLINLTEGVTVASVAKVRDKEKKIQMHSRQQWKLRTVQKQKNLISRQIRRHRMRTEGKRNNHEEMVQISCSRSVGITDTLCGRMRGSES